MGTKAKPGTFDCYANAAPNEPMFILLARDPMAPLLIRMWAHMRWIHGEDRMKVAEALQLALECEDYRLKLKGSTTKYDPFDWLEAVNNAIRAVIPDTNRR